MPTTVKEIRLHWLDANGNISSTNADKPTGKNQHTTASEAFFVFEFSNDKRNRSKSFESFSSC